MKRTVECFLLLLCVMTVASSQTGKDAQHIWYLTLKSDGLTPSERLTIPKNIFVLNDQGQLQVATGDLPIVGGTATDQGFKVQLQPSGSISPITFFLKSVPGADRNGNAGTATFSGIKPVDWVAVTLSYVWECSNHAPNYHLARGEAEMQKLTKEKECQLWHRVKAKEQQAEAKSLSEILVEAKLNH
jgi:hypothetical protein